MESDDDALLVDILIAANRVQSFMANRSKEDLSNDIQLQFAVQKGIEIVGEAAGRLSDSIKVNFPDVPGEMLSACGIASFTTTAGLTWRLYGRWWSATSRRL